MPLNAPATPGALIGTRLPASRLVIIERAVLLAPGAQADDRPAPVADACPQALEAAARLAHGGCQIAIASHHPAVARGLLEMTTVNHQNRRLARQLEEVGGRIDAIAICPHAPDAGCDCRMPRPGMLTDLITRFSVTTGCTLLIAASREAVDAGLAAGCATWWVRPAAAEGENGGRGDVLAVADLADAAERLLSGRLSDDPCTSRDATVPPVTSS